MVISKNKYNLNVKYLLFFSKLCSLLLCLYRALLYFEKSIRQADGQTDDGQQAIKKAHLSFHLNCKCGLRKTTFYTFKDHKNRYFLQEKY